jgi:hypothetical protein
MGRSRLHTPCTGGARRVLLARTTFPLNCPGKLEIAKIVPDF